MTEQHRRNNEDGPTQSNPPDGTDTYVVVATSMKVCRSSPIDTQTDTAILILEARSKDEAEAVARRMALDVARDCSGGSHDAALSFFEAQEFFASEGVHVADPVVVRLSDLPAYTTACASCLEKET